MIIRASQKLFTYAKVVSLTGICAEHLQDFVKHRPLFPCCAHETDAGL